MKIYLLKFYERDEIENFKISDSIEKLKDYVRSEYPDGVSFVELEDLTFIKDDTGYTIGVIGIVEYL